MRLLLIALVAATASPAWSQAPHEAALSPWQEKKCATFAEVYTTAIAKLGKDGVQPEFLESHQAFMESGCMDRKTLCPAPGKELDIANVVSLEMIHLGASGTFLPYDCR